MDEETGRTRRKEEETTASCRQWLPLKTLAWTLLWQTFNQDWMARSHQKTNMKTALRGQSVRERGQQLWARLVSDSRFTPNASLLRHACVASVLRPASTGSSGVNWSTEFVSCSRGCYSYGYARVRCTLRVNHRKRCFTVYTAYSRLL